MRNSVVVCLCVFLYKNSKTILSRMVKFNICYFLLTTINPKLIYSERIKI